MLKPGDHAPAVQATDQTGKAWDLKTALQNGPVVMFFYPKDFTPVCTSEACLFQSHLPELMATGAQLVGISSDDAESHQRFAHKHGLGYPLLVDAGRRIAKAYGALYFGLVPKRITYVIGRDQRVAAAIHHELNANAHVQRALAALRTHPSDASLRHHAGDPL